MSNKSEHNKTGEGIAPRGYGETRAILHCTINYLEDQIQAARVALEKNQGKQLSEIAFDIYSEAEKLYDQIDFHFISKSKGGLQ